MLESFSDFQFLIVSFFSFIELYRKHECLWKIKSKEYSNRQIKEKAYDILVQFVKTVHKSIDKDGIVKKNIFFEDVQVWACAVDGH